MQAKPVYEQSVTASDISAARSARGVLCPLFSVGLLTTPGKQAAVDS